MIDRSSAREADSVIFGCTEIGMLFPPTEAGLPGYDTLEIHAAALVDFALAETHSLRVTTFVPSAASKLVATCDLAATEGSAARRAWLATAFRKPAIRTGIYRLASRQPRRAHPIP